MECTVHTFALGASHYEEELGIPEDLAHLHNDIYHQLPPEVANTFAIEFLEKIAPGADLALVSRKLIFWALTDEFHGMLHFWPESVSLQTAAELYRRLLAGEDVAREEWHAATGLACSSRELVDRAALAACQSADGSLSMACLWQCVEAISFAAEVASSFYEAGQAAQKAYFQKAAEQLLWKLEEAK